MSGTQAQVIPAQQPIGGGITASPLAAAIMGRMGAGLPQGQMSNPLSGLPIGQLAMLLNQNGPNALQPNGYMTDGTPGPAMMGALSQQAAMNVANGAAGM